MQETVVLLQDEPDHRPAGEGLFDLQELLVIAFFGAVAGGSSFEDLEEYTQSNEKFLRGILDLENGIPDLSVFKRLYDLIYPPKLEPTMMKLVAGLRKIPANNASKATLKALRRDIANACKRSPLRRVKVLATTGIHGTLLFCQMRNQGQSSETTAVPALLDLFDLDETALVADLTHKQQATAEMIKAKGCEYVLALKKNQKALNKAVRKYMNDEKFFAKDAFTQPVSALRHSWLETYQSRVCQDIGWLKEAEEWPGLSAIGEVQKTIETLQKTSTEISYFLLSENLSPLTLEEVTYLQRVFGNRMHWLLDIVA